MPRSASRQNFRSSSNESVAGSVPSKTPTHYRYGLPQVRDWFDSIYNITRRHLIRPMPKEKKPRHVVSISAPMPYAARFAPHATGNPGLQGKGDRTNARIDFGSRDDGKAGKGLDRLVNPSKPRQPRARGEQSRDGDRPRPPSPCEQSATHHPRWKTKRPSNCSPSPKIVVRIPKLQQYQPTAANVAQAINRATDKPLPPPPAPETPVRAVAPESKWHGRTVYEDEYTLKCDFPRCHKDAAYHLYTQRDNNEITNEYDACSAHRGRVGGKFRLTKIRNIIPISRVEQSDSPKNVVKEKPVIEQAPVAAGPSVVPLSFAKTAIRGLVQDVEGNTLRLRMTQKATEAKKLREADMRAPRWEATQRLNRGAKKPRGNWFPPVVTGSRDPKHQRFLEQAERDNGWHRIPGYCYMDMIADHWRDNFDWPPLPTVQNLNDLPECCKKKIKGELYKSGTAKNTWHFVWGEAHESVWTAVEALANSSLGWNWIGMDADDEGPGPDLWEMMQQLQLQVANQQNVLNAQMAQIADLNDQNHQLIDQVQAMNAAGIPEPPPPFNAAAADFPMGAPVLPPAPPGPDPMALIAQALQQLAQPRPPAPPKPSAKEPESFDGSMDKTEDFIMDCVLYLNVRGADYPTMQSKIWWALGYMNKGSAATWREVLRAEVEAQLNLFQRMDQFYKRIREDFGDRNQRSTRINQLRIITQGKTRAEEYVNEFRRAALGTDYNDIALIEEFKRGLNASIRRKLVESENQPHDLQEWYDRAVTIDRNWRQNQAEEALYKGRSQNKEEGQNQGNNRQDRFKKRNFNQRSPAPQTAQTSTANSNANTPHSQHNQNDNRRGNTGRVCYNCGRQGHFMRDCRSPRQVREAWMEEVRAFTQQREQAESNEAEPTQEQELKDDETQ